jgi:Holliday junction DNA helicase RuvB
MFRHGRGQDEANNREEPEDRRDDDESAEDWFNRTQRVDLPVDLQKTVEGIEALHGSRIALDERTYLRPSILEEYIGQERVKNTVNTAVQASMIRKTAVPHVLLSGPAGYGKTTLAQIIANTKEVPITNILAAGVTSVQDLVEPILRSGDVPGRVVFIDEIHRLTTRLQEMLYPAMEDFKIMVRKGSGKYSYIEEIQLLPFTLIGATTNPGKLSKPLKDRFGVTLRLASYTIVQLEELIVQSAKKIGVELHEGVGYLIASRCRFSPRQGNHLLVYCRDVALIQKATEVTDEVAEAAFRELGIDELGLDPDDRSVLNVIVDSFGGGPAGLDSIALVADLDVDNITSGIEPLLLLQGLIERTVKGRKITPEGLKHAAVTQGY